MLELDGKIWGEILIVLFILVFWLYIWIQHLAKLLGHLDCARVTHQTWDFNKFLLDFREIRPEKPTKKTSKIHTRNNSMNNYFIFQNIYALDWFLPLVHYSSEVSILTLLYWNLYGEFFPILPLPIPWSTNLAVELQKIDKLGLYPLPCFHTIGSIRRNLCCEIISCHLCPLLIGHQLLLQYPMFLPKVWGAWPSVWISFQMRPPNKLRICLTCARAIVGVGWLTLWLWTYNMYMMPCIMRMIF